MAFYPLEEHEYRYRPVGGSFTNWTPVTVKPIPVGNINVAVGDFQVRIKASGTRPAGNALANLQAFTATVANAAPVANAGADNTITLPTNSVVLQGSGTDSDGTIASYLWAQTIGPNTATFSATNVAQPTVSGMIEGTYQFRLTVTDNAGATHQDTVQIIVNPAPATGPTGYQFVLEGDSQYNNGFGYLVSRDYPDSNLQYFMVSGQTSAQLLNDLGTQLAGAKVANKAKYLYIVYIGTNDICIEAASTINIKNRLKNIVATAHAQGFDVALATFTSMRPGDYAARHLDIEAQRQALNSWMRTYGLDAAEINADIILDYGSIPALAEYDSALNTTYFSDALHWAAAGQDLVYAMMRRGLDKWKAGQTKFMESEGAPAKATYNNVVNATVTEGTGTVTAGSTGSGQGFASATSVERIGDTTDATRGYFEWTYRSDIAWYRAGLTNAYTGPGDTDIRYGFIVDSASVKPWGNGVTGAAAINISDLNNRILRVLLTTTEVRWYVDGALAHTQTLTAADQDYTWQFHVSFTDYNKRVEQLTVSAANLVIVP